MRYHNHDTEGIAAFFITSSTTFGYISIATDHSAYDYAAFVKNAKLVVDTRNATAKVKTGRKKNVKV